MPTMKIFTYNQLFELINIENDRRHHLDTKANTYIGLLSIAITLFGVIGGLLTIEKVEFLRSINFIFVVLIYIFYVLIILILLVAVGYAFAAYHTGSPYIDLAKPFKDRLQVHKLIRFIERKWNSHASCVYLKLNHKNVFSLIDPTSGITRYDLIRQMNDIIEVNRKLNLEKSNNIIIAFYFTMGAIGLLLAMTVYISVITLLEI